MTLFDSLSRFGEKVNEDERLRNMNQDWNRCIHVVAHTGEGATLYYEQGEMRAHEGISGDPDIVLEAPLEVLLSVFNGEASPTEPYMDGSLRVSGSQEDMLRLDFLSLMIWGDE